MLLLNFGHPLTDAHLGRIGELAGGGVERVVAVATHLDHALPFGRQVRELLDAVPLTPEQWQTAPLVVNPPSLAPVVAVLLAELHGRCGYFPPVVRLRPAVGVVPPRYEVAELLDLQGVRDAARSRRG